MRALAVTADRSLELVERPEPRAGNGQVVVEVSFSGICGSDLHFIEIPDLFPAGTVPGHEFCGRIVETGEGVDDWAMGDRVVVLPFGQCGRCDACLAGNEQVCPLGVANGIGLGSGRPGGYADRVAVDASMLFALPDVLSDRDAALVEPVAVSVHAIRLARVQPDESIVVLGAGPIGLCTAAALRALGVRDVVVVSRGTPRVERARALGFAAATLDNASTLIDQTFGVCAPTVVFECSGSAAAVGLACEFAGPLARVVLVGIALEPLTLSALPLVLKEIELKGSLAYRRSDFSEAIELLGGGSIPSGELVTGVEPLTRGPEIFEQLKAPGSDHVKVLLQAT
jgi:2-desacetyl-2-hydroxyethyl bacteriochlorophyllide A dehydrogenase